MDNCISKTGRLGNSKYICVLCIEIKSNQFQIVTTIGGCVCLACVVCVQRVCCVCAVCVCSACVLFPHVHINYVIRFCFISNKTMTHKYGNMITHLPN